MARRRKLETPSSEDLSKLEEEFRRETSTRSAMAPIAQVAADTARAAPVLDPETRAAVARDTADARALREARDKGLVMLDIPLGEIRIDAMIRDRSVLVDSELTELKLSIRQSGLRLPIEVYELPEPEGAQRYGLLSGYRRLMAVQGLNALSPDAGFGTIRALVRAPKTAGDAMAAMVEENEIRASLSHFERGRIASIAAQNGAFVNLEEAVDKLFFAASKAKRSKVRSFAQVFEELGDMLAFPEALTERQGLRLATALRAGGGGVLREALGTGQGSDAASEWALLEEVLQGFEDKPRNPRRGGRPPRRKAPAGPGVIETRNGVILRRLSDDKGYSIRFEGKRVDGPMVDAIMAEVKRLLEDD